MENNVICLPFELFTFVYIFSGLYLSRGSEGENTNCKGTYTVIIVVEFI